MTLVTRALLWSTVLFVASSCHRVATDLTEFERSCEAYCDKLFACFDPLPGMLPDPPLNVQECKDRCSNDLPDDLECIEDDIDYSYCLADMSCEQLEIFYQDPWDDRLEGRCEVELHDASVCE